MSPVKEQILSMVEKLPDDASGLRRDRSCARGRIWRVQKCKAYLACEKAAKGLEQAGWNGYHAGDDRRNGKA